MSLELLNRLNGSSRGKFQRYLDGLEGRCPRICWYPSAGEDLRDLLYLSPHYCTQANPPLPGMQDVEAPTLFLHTDYFPFDRSTFMDSPILFSDDRTMVSLSNFEFLPNLALPVDPRLVDFPKGSHATNRAVFGMAHVQSETLHQAWDVPLLYLFCENTAFAVELAMPAHAKFSHIVRVRIGSGCGGGRSTGAWMRHALQALGTEVLVHDTQWNPLESDSALEVYPGLASVLQEPNLTELRITPGTAWGWPGDITWYRTGVPTG